MLLVLGGFDFGDSFPLFRARSRRPIVFNGGKLRFLRSSPFLPSAQFGDFLGYDILRTSDRFAEFLKKLFEMLVDLVPTVRGPISEGWITVYFATGGQGDGDDVSEYDDLGVTSAISCGLS